MILCYDPYVGTKDKFSSEEIFKIIGDAGYEGINLHVSPPFFDKYNISEIETIEKLAKKYNLKIPSISIGKHTITDPSQKKETMAHFSFCLELAKCFDIKIIGFWPNCPNGLYVEDALETLDDNLRSMIKALGDQDIKLALEFEKNCPLDNYLTTLAFIENHDKRIVITCDTYHLNNYQADPYRSVLRMGENLQEVHISGTHRLEPNSAGDTFDYDAFMKGLKKINFQGPITAQYHLKDTTSIKRVCDFMKEMIR